MPSCLRPRNSALSAPAESDQVCDSPGLRWSVAGGWSGLEERLAVEAPLAVEIAYERLGQTVRKVLAVTMRTPGADADLALGFLFGEGLSRNHGRCRRRRAAEENARGEKISTWCVRLTRAPREDWQRVRAGG